MKAPQKNRDLERPWECRSSAWAEKNVLQGGTFGAFAIGLRGEPACILGRRNKLKMEMPRLRICTKYLWFCAQSLKLWPIFNSLEFASIWQLDSTPSNFRPNMERLNEAKTLYEISLEWNAINACSDWHHHYKPSDRWQWGRRLYFAKELQPFMCCCRKCHSRRVFLNPASTQSYHWIPLLRGSVRTNPQRTIKANFRLLEEPVHALW